jgi:Cu(I)-responsive transcriptional regulator
MDRRDRTLLTVRGQDGVKAEPLTRGLRTRSADGSDLRYCRENQDQHAGEDVMNIGEAAARSGLPAKTIRYYGDIGLVVPRHRRANGYRDYDEQDLHRLKFVQRARSLGFTVEECRELLGLYRDDDRASADVKRLAQKRITDIRRKIEELEAMEVTLARLVEHCQGDHRPDCPILDDLAGGNPSMDQRRDSKG